MALKCRKEQSTRRAGGVAGAGEAEQNITVGVAWDKRGVALRGRNPQPEPLSSRSAKMSQLSTLSSLWGSGFAPSSWVDLPGGWDKESVL